MAHTYARNVRDFIINKTEILLDSLILPILFPDRVCYINA
jgi:hypothetical protein